MRVVDFLEAALDTSSLRHRALASNVANADTPGYKRFDVLFRRELGLRVGGVEGFTTHRRHIPISRDRSEGPGPALVRETGTSVKNDGNNVQIDREMALMAANGIFYGAVARGLDGLLGRLMLAVSEGRR